MILPIELLIKEASTELGSDACMAGKHQWESEGGRACPHDLTDRCSQAVYRCTHCGSYDHGEAGGPGELDCKRNCGLKFERAVAIKLKRIDPLWLNWYSTKAGVAYHKMRLRLLRKQAKPTLP